MRRNGGGKRIRSLQWRCNAAATTENNDMARIYGRSRHTQRRLEINLWTFVRQYGGLSFSRNSSPGNPAAHFMNTNCYRRRHLPRRKFIGFIGNRTLSRHIPGGPHCKEISLRQQDIYDRDMQVSRCYV